MNRITRRDFLRFGFTGAAVVGFGGSLTGCFSPPPEMSKKIIRTAGKALHDRQYLPPLPGRMRHYGRGPRRPIGQDHREPQAPQQPGKAMLSRTCGAEHSL